MQLVYLSPDDFERLLSVGCLPKTGAFVGDFVGESEKNVHDVLTEQLTAWELYRSKIRKTLPRKGVIRDVYAESDGKFIEFTEGLATKRLVVVVDGW